MLEHHLVKALVGLGIARACGFRLEGQSSRDAMPFFRPLLDSPVWMDLDETLASVDRVRVSIEARAVYELSRESWVAFTAAIEPACDAAASSGREAWMVLWTRLQAGRVLAAIRAKRAEVQRGDTALLAQAGHKLSLLVSWLTGRDAFDGYEVRSSSAWEAMSGRSPSARVIEMLYAELMEFIEASVASLPVALDTVGSEGKASLDACTKRLRSLATWQSGFEASWGMSDEPVSRKEAKAILGVTPKQLDKTFDGSDWSQWPLQEVTTALGLERVLPADEPLWRAVVLGHTLEVFEGPSPLEPPHDEVPDDAHHFVISLGPLVRQRLADRGDFDLEWSVFDGLIKARGLHLSTSIGSSVRETLVARAPNGKVLGARIVGSVSIA